MSEKLVTPRSLGGWLDRLAWLAFASLVVLSPLRVGVTLANRAEPQISVSFTQFVVTWTDTLLVATLGLWMAGRLLDRRAVQVGPRWLAVPVVGLLAAAWIGVPWSIDPRLTIYSAAKLTSVVLLGLYVANELDRPSRLAIPVGLMIAIQAAVAIGQFVRQEAIGLRWLGEVPLDPERNGLSIVATVNGDNILRAYGLTPHPNILGGVLAIGLLTLATAIGAGRRDRVLGSIVFAAGVVALFVSFSRSAWLAFGVGSIVALAMLMAIGARSTARRVATVTAAGLVLCVPILLQVVPYVAARALVTAPIPTEQRSVDERLALAQASVDVALERPLLGTGLGTMPLALARDEPEFAFGYQPAHVVVLDAAAETGVVGAACYLAIVVGPWVWLARHRQRWTTWLAGASGALAAVTVIGLFDYYTWAPSGGRLWAWIALGAWVAARRLAVEAPSSEGAARAEAADA